MDNSSYYVHNLSPFIFEVSKIPLEWVLTWKGLLLGLLYVAWEAVYKIKFSKNPQKLPHFLAHGFRFFILITLIFLGMQKNDVQWGLRWYSTMYLLSFIQVIALCTMWIKQRKMMLTPQMLDSLIVYLMLGMILGARVFYVFIYNWDDFSHRPMDIFKVWEGGLSFHGGIVGVITAIVIFCRKYRIPFFHLTDKLVLCVPFGVGIGRLGNFMNGELYGRVIQSHVPWAIIFPTGGSQPRHPSQLYQSLGEGWLLLLTLFMLTRLPRREGFISCAFLFFYGFYRFWVEYFREADEQLGYYFGGMFTMGQILCLVTMVAGIAIYYTATSQSLMEESPDWRKRIDDYLKQREKIEC